MRPPRLLFLLILALPTGCGQPPAIHKLSGPAQGTSYHISYWSERPIDSQALKTQVEAEFARIDQLLSNYRPDSAIEQFNAQATTRPLPVAAEIVALAATARAISQASGGCYDLTITPLFKLWGFGGDRLTPPTPAALSQAMADVGFRRLEIVNDRQLRKQTPRLRVDLSSIAQGHSVARLAGLLKQHQIHNFLVEIGGELQTSGQKPDGQPWRVAIEKPLPDQRSLHKILSINQTQPLAVMTSGTYRHYFDLDGKRHSHILDARTGSPVSHPTVAVTVLHPDPTLADAWSTALLCLGRAEGMAVADQAGIAALFIDQEGGTLTEQRSQALARLNTITLD